MPYAIVSSLAQVEEVLKAESGFLKDNTLLVEVEVTVDNVIEIVEYTDPELLPPSTPTL